MLDGSHRFLFRPRFVLQGFLLASFIMQPVWAEYGFERFLNNPPLIDGDPSHPFDHQWVLTYLETVNENTSLDEVVGFLNSLRDSLVAQGYTAPPLTKVLLGIRDDLIKKGTAVDDEKIRPLYEKLAQREGITTVELSLKVPKVILAGIGPPHIITEGLHKGTPKKNKSKSSSHVRRSENKVDSKMAIGLVKILAGSLLCIIPHPVTITAGGTLALSGVTDCIDAAREKGDENERAQKQGPLANPPPDHHKKQLDR